MSPTPSPRVRPPAVAGTFYPADPTELEAVVQGELDVAEARSSGARRGGPHTAPAPHAIVAPHAGFVYSGSVAASAYARILPRRDEITRVVLLGPNHRVALQAMAIPSVDALATPLGAVPVDAAARTRLAGATGVVVDDRPHVGEHSLEVHLPFLQVALRGPWSVLPVVVGQVPPAQVADVLAAEWGGPETLVVISTDLSHFHDHPTAQALDSETAAAVVARRWADIEPDQACGASPLRGLLVEATRRDLSIELLDLRTSGDTAGGRERVVGYGSFAVG